MTAGVPVPLPSVRAAVFSTEDVLAGKDVFALLRAESVGRVVYSWRAMPAITPVRYAISGSDVLFVTGPDAGHAAAIAGAVVLFEVDRLDPLTGAGWTAAVTGVAEPAGHDGAWRQRASEAGIHPPGDDGWHSVFLLQPAIVHGRQMTDAWPAWFRRP